MGVIISTYIQIELGFLISLNFKIRSIDDLRIRLVNHLTGVSPIAEKLIVSLGVRYLNLDTLQVVKVRYDYSCVYGTSLS